MTFLPDGVLAGHTARGALAVARHARERGGVELEAGLARACSAATRLVALHVQVVVALVRVVPDTWG